MYGFKYVQDVLKYGNAGNEFKLTFLIIVNLCIKLRNT